MSFEKKSNKSNNEQEVEKHLDVEIISKINDQLVEQLVNVEDKVYPSAMRLGQESMRDVLNYKAPKIIIKNKDLVIGYLLTIPAKAEEISEALKKEHRQDKILYVWDIAIEKEYRNLKTIFKLYEKLLAESKKQKYKKIVAHVRVSQRLSKILQQRCGWHFIKREENWSGFGEPFDYLEFDLNKSKKQK